MIQTVVVPQPFDTMRPSLSEARFLRGLGLAPWSTTVGVEVLIGSVRPFEDCSSAAQDSVISIYVYPTPALSYRFTVLRRSEHFDGMETVTLKTGSGAIEEFWEFALALASNTVSVSVPEPLLAPTGDS